MLELNNITLLAVDCRDAEIACRARSYSTREIKFAEVMLFTSADIECRGMTVLKIGTLFDLAGYSHFCLKKLVDYISTDYIITV